MREVKEQKKNGNKTITAKKKKKRTRRRRIERYDLKLTSMVNKALVAKRFN